MKVDFFMTPAARTATVPPTAPLGEAAKKMLDAKAGSIVVIEDGKAVGIITKTDILVAYVQGLGHDVPVRSHRVVSFHSFLFSFHMFFPLQTSTIMATQLATISPNAYRDDAAAALSKCGKHHLIVQDENGFHGIVSSLDITKETAADAKAFPYSREALLGKQ